MTRFAAEGCDVNYAALLVLRMKIARVNVDLKEQKRAEPDERVSQVSLASECRALFSERGERARDD